MYSQLPRPVFESEGRVRYAQPMTTTVEAIYENGVFRPLAAIPLQEHSAVRVVVHSCEDASKSTDSERSEGLRQGELTLLKVWENDEDDVYNALLTK
jgi:predicted DNA-binding antitoxin AbrB/MazE fold protein